MPLAELTGVPRTPSELKGWAFANVVSHRDLIRRVFETTGVQLTEYPLEPFDPEDPDSLQQFLNANQDMHQALSIALKLPSYDLSEVDWSDINDLSRWIFTHAQAHMEASQKLGVS